MIFILLPKWGGPTRCGEGGRAGVWAPRALLALGEGWRAWLELWGCRGCLWGSYTSFHFLKNIITWRLLKLFLPSLGLRALDAGTALCMQMRRSSLEAFCSATWFRARCHPGGGVPLGTSPARRSSSVCPAPQPGKASGWYRGTDVVHHGGDAIRLDFWEKELVECLCRAVPSLMASALLPTPCPSRRT